MSSGHSDLAAALVDALDDAALERLAELLAPRLAAGTQRELRPIAYTVATLAHELGLSPRAVRAAVNRGELLAVKRGRSYLINASSVEAWAAPSAPRSPARERSSRERARRPVMASALARLDRER